MGDNVSTEWIGQSLTDNDLSMKLNELPESETFETVYFNENNLTTLPDLNHYEQFKCLEHLYLCDNKIVSLETGKLPEHLKSLHMSSNQVSELVNLNDCHEIEWLQLNSNKIKSFTQSNLPVNMQYLNLADNQLTALPDISQCHHLAMLILSDNKITHIVPKHLPLNIEYLDMKNNKLFEVRNLTKHKKLKTIDLAGNEIIKVYSANKDISFWVIDTFHEKFFEKQHGYYHLLEGKFNPSGLRQPPKEVFKRGLKSVQMYFKDRRLLVYSRTR